MSFGHAALLAAMLATASASAGGTDAGLSRIAQEARETIAVIDWFYIQHRACPQPSRPDELAELQGGLGDGFEVEPRGQFTEIRGISMSGPWLYYTSPEHPEKCSLWRKLGWDPALIWRHRPTGGDWLYDPGDGTPERPLTPARQFE